MHTQPKGDGAGPEKERSREVIFVVDDEPMMLELAETILATLGCEVKAFTSPEAALEAYQKSDPQPAIVVTDFSMPRMSGQDLLLACREICPEQKVLVVSGTVESDVFGRTDVQPTAFLSKPFHATELLDAVSGLLRR
jgi:DNA-binding NtrC family response regulator